MSTNTKVRNIGIPGVTPPQKVCENDPNCPFHGERKLRGRIFTGKVVSTKRPNTISVERSFDFYIQKYERYERRHTKMAAHLPACIEVAEGDTVRIAECRKISKSVAFVVIQRISEGA